MKNILMLIIIFMLGFIARDLINAVTTTARAEVAGMDYSDLKSDYDFKKAVKYIVESCTVSDSSISC